jgi:stage V sporulation protein S
VRAILRVKADSESKKVAGAIAGELRQFPSVELQVVGAGAVSQAVKAIIIARGYLAPSGFDLTCAPAFFATTNGGKEWTGIRFVVVRTA